VQQLVIAGCLRALSGRDDLVHDLLQSSIGQRWQIVAIRAECRVLLCVWVARTSDRLCTNAPIATRCAASVDVSRLRAPLRSTLPEVQRYMSAKCT
jgi:hypothetical protein